MALGETDTALQRFQSILGDLTDTRKILAIQTHFTKQENEAGAEAAKGRACELGHKRSCPS